MSNYMTPTAFYEKRCETGDILPDEQQRKVLLMLEKIHHDVLSEHKKRNGIIGLFHKWQTMKGLYLWGDVGTGKTFLLDCFYETLPISSKKRIHFHYFMQWVHQELKQMKNLKDPLFILGKKVANETMVLCFDEFIVDDIANAMLLRALFTAFFKHGITLLATSNTAPDRLYWRGLQREQFLPAIELIKTYTNVYHIESHQDYRLRHVLVKDTYLTPNDEIAHEKMDKLFNILTTHEKVDHFPIALDERLIPIVKKSLTSIWFQFKDLCESPMSAKDYMEIAKQFKTIFISDVRVISPDANNTIIRFINLIDIFYENNVRVIFSAEKPPYELYISGSKLFSFQRTASRLIEMQSEAYWRKVSNIF